jgi:hypothetical protein
MKEETQEAAERYAEPYRCPKTADTREYCKHDIISAFNNGAKWQSERMYSEEEVKFIISEALQSALVKVDLEQWFNQFHKKK